MPINEIADGVFETDETRAITTDPASIPYNHGFIGIGVLGTDSLAEKDAIVAWIVKQAQDRGRWAALRLGKMLEGITAHCLSEEAAGTPIEMRTADNLFPYFQQLINEGYLQLTRIASGAGPMDRLAIGPTRKLERALASYRERTQ